MTDQELVPTEGLNTLATRAQEMLPQAMSTEEAKEFGGEYTYLPYITLIQKSSDLTSPPFSMDQGTFALKHNRNTVENLGVALDVFLCDWRLRAMFHDKVQNKMIVLHDKEDPRFREFVSNAENRVKNYYWGYEFLIYDFNLDEYYTLFCNNMTLRRAAREQLLSLLRKQIRLASSPLSTEEHSWWGVTGIVSNEPVSHEPDLSRMAELIAEFQKPTVANVEDTDDSAEEDRDR